MNVVYYRAETDGATSGERGEDEGHGNIIAYNGYVLGFTNRIICDNFSRYLPHLLILSTVLYSI